MPLVLSGVSSPLVMNGAHGIAGAIGALGALGALGNVGAMLCCRRTSAICAAETATRLPMRSSP